MHRPILAARASNNLTYFVLCLSFLLETTTSKTWSIPSVPKASTCPFRTINYITQCLPQQCLRTSWSSETTSTVYSSAPSIVASDHKPTHTYNNGRSTNIGAGDKENLLATADSTALIISGASIPLSNPPSPSHTPEALASSFGTVVDVEGDPLSDNANFLSFEEWKSQMLSKAGQNPEHLGSNRVGQESRKRPSNINDALDSLGEDAEIELDFSGFVTAEAIPDASSTTAHGSASVEMDQHSHVGLQKDTNKRSKDAGTTCKERFNYASFDCAATVLKTNPECKGSTSVLVENKDSYMLNLCSAKNKYFIVELCNDILIDTVVLGSFEFFSSTFRMFRVSVSDRYPVKMEKWRELGTFEARNSRDVQAFVVENPLIWSRYLRIEFLTHYGNEYYCPVSLLRIHGKTMMDDYRNEVKAARGEEDLDDDVIEVVSETSSNLPGGMPLHTTFPRSEIDILSEEEGINGSVIPVAAESTLPQTFTILSSIGSKQTSNVQSMSSISLRTTYNGPLIQQSELLGKHCRLNSSFCNVDSIQRLPVSGRLQPQRVRESFTANSSISQVAPLERSKNNTNSDTTRVSLVNASRTRSNQPSPHVSSEVIASVIQNITNSSTSQALVKTQGNQTSQLASRVLYQPPVPTPSTQESFFRSIHKRLQLLEANSTLSLQYIEEQSRILREAFSKVERRQLAKTTTFLETLNTTVLSELREFRLQYDQIWQSTVLELSSQREQSQREILALTSRLTILADEILFQKRIVILLLVLILLCLGLAIFSPRLTTSNAAYLELPTAVHNMVTRPSSGFARYLHLDSPPATPSRPGSRYGFFSRTVNHIRSPSNQSTLDRGVAKSSEAEYRSPSPLSDGSDNEKKLMQKLHADESTAEGVGLRRTASSPAITGPNGSLDEIIVSASGQDVQPETGS
ncbi:hypothetical protein MMC34_007523 [Xylographa carneopallida]|nr:hypothetical protein [Xylographa carneopallida]